MTLLLAKANWTWNWWLVHGSIQPKSYKPLALATSTLHSHDTLNRHTTSKPDSSNRFASMLTVLYQRQWLGNQMQLHQPSPPQAPRIRLANWTSFCMMVTRLAWMAHRFVSSKRWTMNASAASCKAWIACDCHRRDSPPTGTNERPISRTYMMSSQQAWYIYKSWGSLSVIDGNIPGERMGAWGVASRSSAGIFLFPWARLCLDDIFSVFWVSFLRHISKSAQGSWIGLCTLINADKAERMTHPRSFFCQLFLLPFPFPFPCFLSVVHRPFGDLFVSSSAPSDEDATIFFPRATRACFGSMIESTLFRRLRA